MLVRAGKMAAALLLLAGSSALGALPVKAGGEGEVPAPWQRSIKELERALERGDVRAAMRAREDARLAALASPRWEGMLAVGDATIRLARRAGLEPAMEPAVRRAYWSALVRARRQGSVDGALRVSEAFADLGDHAMARKGFAVAQALTTVCQPPNALERVRALERRLSTEMAQAGASLPDQGTSDGGSHGAK